MIMSSPLLSCCARAFWFSWQGPWQNSVNVINVCVTKEKSEIPNLKMQFMMDVLTVHSNLTKNAQTAFRATANAVQKSQCFSYQIVIRPIPLSAQKVLKIINLKSFKISIILATWNCGFRRVIVKSEELVLTGRHRLAERLSI